MSSRTAALGLVLVVVVSTGCAGEDGGNGVETSTTSSSTQSPAGDSVPATTAPPPPVKLTTGDETVVLEPYDYCWMNMCADSFGSKEPDRATVSTEDVKLEWQSDGTLTAHVDKEGCRIPLALDEIGVGVWQLAMPESPGVTLIYLHGSAPEGSTSFLLEASTTVPGRTSTPVVEIGWPVTNGPVSILVNIAGYTGDDNEAILAFESADGTKTRSTLELVLTEYEPGCPVLFNELDIDVSQLGAPPIESRLHLDKFAVQWMWPDEFVDRDQSLLVRPMTPVDG